MQGFKMRLPGSFWMVRKSALGCLEKSLFVQTTPSLFHCLVTPGAASLLLTTFETCTRQMPSIKQPRYFYKYCFRHQNIFSNQLFAQERVFPLQSVMEVVFWCSNEQRQFRLPEIEALADMLGIQVPP